MTATKPFTIPKRLVYDAWKAVKANAGSAGVDKETIDDFEADLKNNLYRIWNRMSSGSYFPPPVKAVAIPKKNGGERILGVPTVADRVAQMVVKMTLEPAVERIFLPDSYGYRPGKSALDAVAVTRTRCWKYDWVLEFDIKGLFDNIDHGLLRKAIEKHTQCEWVRLYIGRWLTAPLQVAEGTLVERTKGTPQGGVVTPRTQKITLPLNAHSTSIGVSRFLICVINSNTVMSHAAIDRHANGSPSERRVRVARSRPQRGGGHHDPVQRLRDFAPSGLPIRPAGPDPRRSACGYRTDNPGHREAARRHGTPSPGPCRQQRPDSGRDRRARPRSVYRSGPGPCLTGPAAPSVSSTLSTACSAPSSNWSMRRWFRTGGGGLASQLM
ncbi:MAG: revT1 [Propionibacteriaceae bacterium]|nr:revT1 [Propionibacteriaceae bacterium]